MKVTININGVDVEIQLTPEQEALAIKQAKPKFKWHYLFNNSFRLANTKIIFYESGSSATLIEHGRYRKTQSSAEQSLARNKRANRLEALAEQLNGLTEFIVRADNYYIYYWNKKWSIGIAMDPFFPEVVYMTETCATEICRMLNEGEFSLDGEL